MTVCHSFHTLICKNNVGLLKTITLAEEVKII